MDFDAVLALARQGRLYPAVILHGASPERRREAALALARTLLCERDASERPCGVCRHCRRVLWPEPEAETFHPDFRVLERDLRTSTSAEAVRGFLRAAFSSPFEARGQVFVIAEAETLTGEAADSLLKLLEEPPSRSPRHFLLSAPVRLDLLPTLRSRSLAIYLGAQEALDAEAIAELAASFSSAIAQFRQTRSAVFLLAAAGALEAAGGWDDPRARRPWALASAAIVRSLETLDAEPPLRRRLLELAQALLEAPQWRVRAISPGRLLEGLLSRYLAGPAGSR